jgi:hypothetical protein
LVVGEDSFREETVSSRGVDVRENVLADNSSTN